MRSKKILQSFSIALLFGVFFIPYCVGIAWKFILTTPLILGLAWISWPSQWTERLGLHKDARLVFQAIVLGIVFFGMGHFLIPHILGVSGMSYQPYVKMIWRISPLFQAFNEEIVLRALLLTSLIPYFKSPLRLSLLVALSFSALHGLFYLYSMEGATILTPLTLLNLTLFGFICNHLFLSYNSIWYGAALHIGWNLTRFSGWISLQGRPMSEGETFNAIEGSWFLTFLLMSLLFLAIRMKNQSRVSLAGTR